MRFLCNHCQRAFDISGEPPSFCPYCGKSFFPGEGSAEANLPSSGVWPLAPDAMRTPETIGGYRLLRPLGSGGMGTVHEAEEIATGRHVAVKLLRPGAASSPEALKRFRQEGRLASQINHPNCVFVVAADEENGRPYIVMELMTGDTLKDLIEQQGPLPSEEAVAKVLDIIAGLKEAHARGMIHRDVKPSNCFVLPDGRVKVGDFGLVKSLNQLTHVTTSGTFLGTVLYAAPEQIRGEPLDYRTDGYAVAATLYYLLGGQAPFQSKGNAPAALAAIVSQPVPPLHDLAPEISPALEKVVLRGLERNPARRWPDLEAFRAALLPFLPGRLSFGSMTTRLGAFLLDFALLVPFLIVTGYLPGLFPTERVGKVAGFLALNVLFALYLLILEGAWRASLGKRLLRLRVCVTESAERAGLRRATIRTLVFLCCIALPLLRLELDPENLKDPWWLAFQGLGLALLTGPMWFTSGYRGLHELLSGTQVVTLPPPESRQLLESRRPDRQLQGLGRPEGMPEVVGSYPVRGALSWGETEQVLLAEDPTLWRDLWIWLRPASATPLTPARRGLDRPSRLRWVTGGHCGAMQWDAFVASPGCPLPDLVEHDAALEWREGRLIVQQLADEFTCACADGTMAETLNLDQVWVHPSGRVQLLDFPLHTPATPERLALASGERRALACVGQAATLALEGRSRPADAPLTPIKAPLPDHAARTCRRLLGVHDPYVNLADLQADFTATRDRPTEVTRAMRAGHLGLVFLFLFPGLSQMLLAQMLLAGREYQSTLEAIVGWFMDVGLDQAREIISRSQLLSLFLDPLLGRGAIAIWPALWIGWTFLMRGALSSTLAGVAVVRANGRRASRLQYAWRDFLAWLPIATLLSISANLKGQGHDVTALWVWWAAVCLLLAYVAGALIHPRRSMLDWLARTYLVPR